MNEIPEVVQSWIGKRRHEEVGEFDVERGFVLTGCSSVENGNPLYWSEGTANDITGGWIAPPTMISLRSRLFFLALLFGLNMTFATLVTLPFLFVLPV